MITLPNYPIAKDLFRKHFQNNISKYYEKELSACFAQVLIDILSFDEWLHEVHGNYEEKGYTLKTLVIEVYGLEAYEFLNEVTQ